MSYQVQNFQKFRCGYECPTERTEVLCRVIPGVTRGKYPGYGLYVPYRTQPWKDEFNFLFRIGHGGDDDQKCHETVNQEKRLAVKGIKPIISH